MSRRNPGYDGRRPLAAARANGARRLGLGAGVDDDRQVDGLAGAQLFGAVPGAGIEQQGVAFLQVVGPRPVAVFHGTLQHENELDPAMGEQPDPTHLARYSITWLLWPLQVITIVLAPRAQERNN